MTNIHAQLAIEVGFQVDNGSVSYADRPRPASREETVLWGAAVQAKAAFKQSQKERAALEADKASLSASCEAYRRELETLRVYVEANWISPAVPPASVPTLDMFAEIVQSHNAQKKRLLDKAREIWDIPPGTDIFDFMFRKLQDLNGEMYLDNPQGRTLAQQVDANKVIDSFGTPANPTVGER